MADKPSRLPAGEPCAEIGKKLCRVVGRLLSKSQEQTPFIYFAAGGILYLIFQDIAPQSKMRRHWMPPLGAVLGFVVGMIGKQLIG